MVAAAVLALSPSASASTSIRVTAAKIDEADNLQSPVYVYLDYACDAGRGVAAISLSVIDTDEGVGLPSAHGTGQTTKLTCDGNNHSTEVIVPDSPGYPSFRFGDRVTVWARLVDSSKKTISENAPAPGQSLILRSGGYSSQP